MSFDYYSALVLIIIVAFHELGHAFIGAYRQIFIGFDINLWGPYTKYIKAPPTPTDHLYGLLFNILTAPIIVGGLPWLPINVYILIIIGISSLDILTFLLLALKIGTITDDEMIIEINLPWVRKHE